jgi:hypothetical protein
MVGQEPLLSSLFQVGLVSNPHRRRRLVVQRSGKLPIAAVALLSTRDGEHDTKARNGRLVARLLGCYTVRVNVSFLSRLWGAGEEVETQARAARGAEIRLVGVSSGNWTGAGGGRVHISSI